ncbi:MAG: PRC-barrel domain-containing protein [Solirubrobacteraceae bacterium]
MDHGAPIAYMALAEGTEVLSSDGEAIGRVVHVLADESEDVFDGIVIAEHAVEGAHRFADADDVDTIYERAVVLRLDRAECERLPAPSANPAVMRDDPAQTGDGPLSGKLRRAWDLLSGNY